MRQTRLADGQPPPGDRRRGLIFDLRPLCRADNDAARERERHAYERGSSQDALGGPSSRVL